MCFPSLTRNISLCAPTHCAPWPLAMRRRDDGKRRSRVCARPAVFVFALGTRSSTSGWSSLAAAQRAVTLLEASKDLEIINQVLKVKATLSPSFPSLATADRTVGCQESVTLFRRPFLAKLKILVVKRRVNLQQRGGRGCGGGPLIQSARALKLRAFCTLAPLRV